MDKLGHTGVFPEGRFFPDTYRFVRGMSDVELLQQAYMRLDEVLAKEWAERTTDLPYRDPYQALIMASLVEKETGIPQSAGRSPGFSYGACAWHDAADRPDGDLRHG